MPVNRWSRSQLTGQSVHYLLTMGWGGRTIRLAQSELDIASDDGDLHYDGGLGDMSVAQSLDLFSDSASMLSVPIEALLPLDAAAWVAAGHDLAAATAELSEWVEGTAYEARRVILRGHLSDPEYGDLDTPFRCSIEENLFDDRSSIPEALAIVDQSTLLGSDTFLTATDKGLAYPVIIGQPGRVSSEASGWVTGSQAVWLSHRGAPSPFHQVCIAGHAVQAQYVYANTDGDTDGVLFRVATTKDKLGRTITTIESSNNATTGTTPGGFDYEFGLDSAEMNANHTSFQPADTETVGVFIGWFDPENPSYGGALGANGLVRGAGDVLLFLADYSSIRFDRARIAAIAPRLNGYKIDAVIDAQTSPWEWIRANLLPILPVSVATGPDGIYFAVWDYAATAGAAVATLDGDADPQIDFAERVKYDTTEIANQFSLDYALSVRTDNYQRNAKAGYVRNNYATCKVISFDTAGAAEILITSTLPDGAGDEWTVTIDGSGGGGGSETYQESTSQRVVLISVPNAGAGYTSDDFIAGINANLTTVRASLLGGDVHAMEGDDDLGTGGSRQSVTMSIAGDYGPGSDYFCDLSQARYAGVISPTGRVEKKEESIVVYDDATAQAILGWWTRAYCFGRRTVELVAPMQDWAWLELGNTVLLTCARLGLARQVALVQTIEGYDTGMMGIRALIVDDSPRDRRA